MRDSVGKNQTYVEASGAARVALWMFIATCLLVGLALKFCTLRSLCDDSWVDLPAWPFLLTGSLIPAVVGIYLSYVAILALRGNALPTSETLVPVDVRQYEGRAATIVSVAMLSTALLALALSAVLVANVVRVGQSSELLRLCGIPSRVQSSRLDTKLESVSSAESSRQPGHAMDFPRDVRQSGVTMTLLEVSDWKGSIQRLPRFLTRVV
jgi:hypothetical protein